MCYASATDQQTSSGDINTLASWFPAVYSVNNLSAVSPINYNQIYNQSVQPNSPSLHLIDKKKAIWNPFKNKQKLMLQDPTNFSDLVASFFPLQNR